MQTCILNFKARTVIVTISGITVHGQYFPSECILCVPLSIVLAVIVIYIYIYYIAVLIDQQTCSTSFSILY